MMLCRTDYYIEHTYNNLEWVQEIRSNDVRKLGKPFRYRRLHHHLPSGEIAVERYLFSTKKQQN